MNHKLNMYRLASHSFLGGGETTVTYCTAKLKCGQVYHSNFFQNPCLVLVAALLPRMKRLGLLHKTLAYLFTSVLGGGGGWVKGDIST